MRRFSSLILFALFVAGAHGETTDDDDRQTTQPPPSKTEGSPRSTSTAPTTHTITVGAEGYEIKPNKTDAEVAGVVEWEFHSGRHWIIKGYYEYPCVPFEYSGLDRVGFSSWEQAVDEGQKAKPVFQQRINDTYPILFYSGAPDACVDHLMMGVINPSPVRNLGQWKEKAEKMTFQLRPGDPWPSVEDEPTPTPSSMPTEPSAALDGQETAAPADTEAGGGGGGLGDGAIAGIVIGVAVALALVGVVTFYCGRRGGIRAIFQSTNEDDSGERAGEDPKSPTSGTMRAPIRPPRTPHTEDWMPAIDDRGNLPQHGTPIIPASMYSKPPPQVHPPVPVASPSSCYSVGEPAPYQEVTARPLTPRGSPVLSPSADRPSLTGSRARSPLSESVETGVGPAELPAIPGPGESSLPPYHPGHEPRKFSWSGTGEGALFRPYYP